MLPNTCQWSGVALTTTSTFGSSRMRRESCATRGARPCALSTAFRAPSSRRESGSQTQAISASLRLAKAWARYEPRPPTPITPMRIFSFGEAALAPGRTLKAAEAAREVLTKVRRVMAFMIFRGTELSFEWDRNGLALGYTNGLRNRGDHLRHSQSFCHRLAMGKGKTTSVQPQNLEMSHCDHPKPVGNHGKCFCSTFSNSVGIVA